MAQIGSEVKFGGFVIAEEGNKPDPDKCAAIKHFPAPKNLTDLRSFIGLSNQFGDFSPDLKIAMEPLKALLQVKNA